MEMQRVWNVKTIPIAVIEGATGSISKTFRKNVKGFDEQRQMAIMVTALILREVLM